MDHVSTIKMLIQALSASSEMHALIVEGPAGWGKTTAVDEALRALGIGGAHLGAYSTPLHLFNFLAQHNSGVIVIDDCAGLFGDQSSMAILKAATWGGVRRIKWGSTSSRAMQDEFVFSGKLIIVCNTFPSTPDAEAVRSRSFPHKISVSETTAKNLLVSAAGNRAWFAKPKTAEAVARFLAKRISAETVSQVSYRTLRMGYELAEHTPAQWQDLLAGMLPIRAEDPKRLLKRLAKQGIKVKDQAREFQEATGLKRRTFFKYRRELDLGK